MQHLGREKVYCTKCNARRKGAKEAKGEKGKVTFFFYFQVDEHAFLDLLWF